jgi:iron complex outermembrane receptor protein
VLVTLCGAAHGEERPQDLEPMRVEGLRLLPYEDVLDADDLTHMNADDAGAALSVLPGVSMLRKGGIANDVVIRGFHGNDFGVMVDDQMLFGAGPHQMDPTLSHVNLEEVERIEVIKGPFDVRHMGGMGGMVNVITKKPQNGWHADVDMRMGSYSLANPAFNASYGSKQGYVSTGFAYDYSMPYKDGSGHLFNTIGGYARDHRQAYSTRDFWGKFGIAPAEGHLLEFAYRGQQANDVLFPYLMMDEKHDATDGFEGTYTISQGLGVLQQLQLKVYSNHVAHQGTDAFREYFDPQQCTAGYCMGMDADNRTSGVRLEGTMDHLVLGVEGYRRTWKASHNMLMGMGQYMTLPMIPDVATMDYGLYGEYKAQLAPRWHLVSGLRLDTNKTAADDGAVGVARYELYHHTQDVSRRNTYPSGNVQLLYDLTQAVNLFAGLGHGVRAPDGAERYILMNHGMTGWVGNPNLNPAKNTELDLGAGLAKGSISSRITAYYSEVDDFIETYSSGGKAFSARPPVQTYGNIDARFYGAEWQNAWQMTPAVSWTADLSYARGRKDTDPNRNMFSANVEEIPPMTGRLAWHYDRQRYFARVEGVFSAAQHAVNADLHELKTAGYSVFNISGGLHEHELAVLLGIDNLFDKTYTQYLSYLRDPFATGLKIPEPGRFFYARVSCRF